MKKIMRTHADLQKIAEDHHWQLNPNLKVVENILKVENKYKIMRSAYYCPCRSEFIADNICPCIHAEAEIQKDGKCHCNLFLKRK